MTLPRAVQNGWTDRFAIWVVDSGWPKEAQVQSYLTGGANGPSWEGTLVPPGEYDWAIRFRRRCGLMWKYCFDHLFVHYHHFLFFDWAALSHAVPKLGVHWQKSPFLLQYAACYAVSNGEISAWFVIYKSCHIGFRAGSVLKPKPKPRFSVKTEPKPKPRFRWESQSVLRPQ